MYLIDDIASVKKKIAISIIDNIGFISPQVIFECLNVCIKKQKLDRKTALHFVNFLLKSSNVQLEDGETIKTALLIFDKYQLQSYDSKIVASALQADCTILYSEDMHHGLIVENRLTIVNPFI